MIKAKLIRFMETDAGTQGVLLSDKFCCFTLELPNRENKINISCIPQGTYTCKYKYSKKFKNVFHLQNVKDRTYIYIHNGNFAGDINKGFRTHTEGCILIGGKFGVLNNQLAILNSRNTMKRLFKRFEKETFELTIKENFI